MRWRKVLPLLFLFLVLFSTPLWGWTVFFEDARVTEDKIELAPGVELFKLEVRSPSDNHLIQIVRVDHGDQDISLRSALGGDTLTPSLETVRSQARKVDSEEEKVVAGINADFFQLDRNATTYGVPLGMHVQERELVTSPVGSPTFALDEGRLFAEIPRMVIRATHLGPETVNWDVDAVNRRVEGGELTV